MLPHRLLEVERTPDGRAVPRWLSTRDEPWLRELLAEAAAGAGRAVEDVNDRVVEVVAPIARRHGASRRLVEAAWTVERRRWASRVDAPIAPALIRRTLFPLSAERSREEALATTATELGIDAARIEEWLFADRPRARLLVAPASTATTAGLLESYNLAIVQSLLVRATEVTAVARANVRNVVRYAKLLGLMLAFDEAADGAARLTLSGPLAIFHDTVKYGHALSRWLPSLVTTPGWSMSARVLLSGESLRFELDAGAPLPRTHAMPRAHDSALEARLEKDLRKLASEWRVEREATVIRVPSANGTSRLVFPDFALVGPRGRVIVEVVGWWTPEYLEDKLAMLETIRAPLVLCVDERHARGALRTDPRVLLFKKRIDAAGLLRACEDAVALRRAG